MLQSILSWMFGHKFIQQTSAAVVGTGVSAATLFGIYDAKTTAQFKEISEKIDTKANVIYVDHQNEVVQINVNNITKHLDKIERIIEKNQDETNKRLYELKQGR